MLLQDPLVEDHPLGSLPVTVTTSISSVSLQCDASVYPLPSRQCLLYQRLPQPLKETQYLSCLLVGVSCQGTNHDKRRFLSPVACSSLVGSLHDSVPTALIVTSCMTPPQAYWIRYAQTEVIEVCTDIL